MAAEREEGKKTRTSVERSWREEREYELTQVRVKGPIAKMFIIAILVAIFSVVTIAGHFAMVQYPVHLEVGVYEGAILDSPDATILLQRLQDYRVLLDEKFDGSEHYSLFFPNYHNSMEFYKSQIDSVIERTQGLETWYLNRGYDTEIEDVYQEKLDNIIEITDDIMGGGFSSNTYVALSIEQNAAFHFMNDIAWCLVIPSIVGAAFLLFIVVDEGFYEWQTIEKIEIQPPKEKKDDDESEEDDDGKEVVVDV